MMTNPPNPDQLTVDDLRAYQAGQLSGTARHRVERLLLEQPFYADALAGLDALQQSGASLPAQTAQLRSALHRRIRESATKQRLWPLWLTTAIAAIMLVLCITIYLIFFTKPARPTRPQPHTKPGRQSVAPSVRPNSTARLTPAGAKNWYDSLSHDACTSHDKLISVRKCGHPASYENQPETRQPGWELAEAGHRSLALATDRKLSRKD